MLPPGFWSGIITCLLIVLMVLVFSYGTGGTIEVGDIKIGAIPQIEDPAMKRCKAVQASVENDMKAAFAEVKNALASSMRDAQEQELKATALLADMVKSRPDDTWAINSLVDSMNNYRVRYSSLETDVNNRLAYIAQTLDYILRGCGLSGP